MADSPIARGVRFALQLPIIRDLHARNLLFPTLVLLAVMGVLVQGALAPEPVEPTAQEAAPEPPTPLLTLRPDLEKTALSYTADYWLQLGERVRASLVLVGRDGTPGVVVAPGQVVSALRAADELLAERLEATAARERDRAKSGSSEDAGTVDGQGEPSAEGTGPPSELEPFSPTGVDPEHGVALFKLGNTVSATPVQRANPDAFRPGAHVAAVSLTAGNDLRITPGVLVSVEEGSGYPEQDASIGERFDVAIPFPPGTRTAAIVDLDGGLLGVAIESPSGIQVLSVGTVERIASALQERRPCLSIETTDLTEEVRGILRVRSGVLVERVRQDAFLPEPSVQAGDILLRWDGKEVNGAEEWKQIYGDQEPGSLVRYVLQRGGRRVSGATRMPGPDCHPVARSMETFVALGLVLRWDAGIDHGPPEGWTVMGAVSDAPAARAGLLRGDRVVAVQGRALTFRNRRRDLEPFERGDSTLALTVWRGERVQLIAVSPPSEEPAKQDSGPRT